MAIIVPLTNTFAGGDDPIETILSFVDQDQNAPYSEFSVWFYVSYLTSFLGPELFVDPGFDDATKWTPGANWTVNSGGNSKAVKTSGGGNICVQDAASGGAIGLLPDTDYQIQIEITSLTAGTIAARIDNELGAAHSSPGTYVEILNKAGSITNDHAGCGGPGTAVGEVESMSLRLVESGSDLLEARILTAPSKNGPWSTIPESGPFKLGARTGSSSTVATAAAVGDIVLSVSSGDGFKVGDIILIDPDGAGQQLREIASISVDDLTLTERLTKAVSGGAAVKCVQGIQMNIGSMFGPYAKIVIENLETDNTVLTSLMVAASGMAGDAIQ